MHLRFFSVAGPVDAYEYFASSWRSDVADTKIVCKEGLHDPHLLLMAGGRVPTREELKELFMEAYKGREI